MFPISLDVLHYALYACLCDMHFELDDAVNVKWGFDKKTVYKGKNDEKGFCDFSSRLWLKEHGNIMQWL